LSSLIVTILTVDAARAVTVAVVALLARCFACVVALPFGREIVLKMK
jgi:hypothetical protein